MLACSLVHEGYICQSLSRIQVLQDSFIGWPDDIDIEQCRQCLDPACVEACPVGALHVDTENGNIRSAEFDFSRDYYVACEFTDLDITMQCVHFMGEMKFYENGNVKSGDYIGDTPFKVGDEYYNFKRGGEYQMTFHENGMVKSGPVIPYPDLSRKFTLKDGSKVRIYRKAQIEFDDKGNVLSVKK